MLATEPLLADLGVAGRIASAALLAAVGLAAFLVALDPGRKRWLAAAMAAPGTAIELAHYAFPQSAQRALAIVLHVSFALFLA